ncbi:hypothetical protein CLPU_1c03450 [Gottschalkia purinilytica]|uniref:DUF2935 domain-containing protein n=1 Tax=Gottschalkia purinilytica TaxID=1503 RepID=A0A0L0WFI1_GOTPU|nr:DUF2935 domain-containing protein [Gottschalkia purinilytica]KNF10180.1 hypothetical protein CLPU_1c03450 [Gottschalkia purinilytica]
MISRKKFIRMSIELNLFFARIMKEHSLFLAVAFTPRDSNLAQMAIEFERGFAELLIETLFFSNGIISPRTIKSGELVTQFTLDAERATEFYTGIQINTNITQAELELVGDTNIRVTPMLEESVFTLNQKAIGLTRALANFKSRILDDVLSCKMFTTNYPLLIDHIRREARFYLKMLQRLQRREEIDLEKEMVEQETFWNRIMAEHAKFIRGFLDPTEEELMSLANNFANEFDELIKEGKEAIDRESNLIRLTNESLKATREIRDFKAQGTEGIIDCKIKSIILPLLGDHTLKEANHYLRLLKIFKKRD